MSTVRDDTATTAARRMIVGAGDSASGVVRDDTATTCGMYGHAFERHGRQRFCSALCRQAAWRRRQAAPAQPVVAKADTVYE